ncbi:uncharacterized protein CCR75_008853 [Bremia lactucae]|uniref:Uncharacterized protein n=1 Tax=Bremia lactucae TaxID=4779 RepID=A0A976FDA5_BRELC|nr:hypothetical protein CCR75_008853 [Bremia lactucae]
MTTTSKYDCQSAEQLLQRWQSHCEGAQVQIQIGEVLKTDLHADSSSSSFNPLFCQETQLLHVSVDNIENEVVSSVTLEAQFDLKIRHEFLGRQLRFLLNITPNSTIVTAPGIDGKLAISELKSLSTSLLRDEWALSQLLSLTREQLEPMSMITRCVEHDIVVTKPMQLEVDSRMLGRRRVGITACVFNSHLTLSLAVQDLDIHLEQLSRQNASNTGDLTRFCVVSVETVLFPVVLQPQERYKFLFVLEPFRDVQHHESLKCVSGDDKTTIKDSPPIETRPIVPTQQQIVLTLSWLASAYAMDAITEDRTVVWSPMHSISSLLMDGNKWRPHIEKLMAYVQTGDLRRKAKPSADFKCVQLFPDSVLQATLAPLTCDVSLGTAAVVCVTIVNRSAHVDYDLTLVWPSQENSGIEGDTPAVVGFEASHRLG